jgi:hypothetical protein
MLTNKEKTLIEDNLNAEYLCIRNLNILTTFNKINPLCSFA